MTERLLIERHDGTVEELWTLATGQFVVNDTGIPLIEDLPDEPDRAYRRIHIAADPEEILTRDEAGISEQDLGELTRHDPETPGGPGGTLR